MEVALTKLSNCAAPPRSPLLMPSTSSKINTWLFSIAFLLPIIWYPSTLLKTGEVLSALADRVSLALVRNYFMPSSSHTTLAADVLPMPGVPLSSAHLLFKFTLPDDLLSNVKSMFIARQFLNHVFKLFTAVLLPTQSTLFFGFYLSTQSGLKFSLIKDIFAIFLVKTEL